MLASLRSAAVFGIEALPVVVEVDVSSMGLPVFTMVGLPDASVRESRDRVRSAIRNSGYDFPQHRVTVNLAPADVRKAGASYDLPIALGILAATGVIERRHVDDVVLLGELSLDGSIQPIRGALPIAVAARREGKTAMLLPRTNAAEAAVVGALRILPVDSLGEAVQALNQSMARGPTPATERGERSALLAPLPEMAPAEQASPATVLVPGDAGELSPDFADVLGQRLAKRALEVAAAGGHNVLLIGPPGGGKTMMARRLPGILPPLDFDEALDCTSIHSVAGLVKPGCALINRRPFRAPHHTISDVAMVGGGPIPRPGEISLAHHGVLFLDEMPEFNRSVLEVLRQPLEEGRVTIARAARTAVFPARFTLVGAMNPCMCGYRGDPLHECRCTPLQVQRYRNRISGPLRDRIDLIVDVPAVPFSTLTAVPGGERSAVVRQRVVEARERQAARLRDTTCPINASLQGQALRGHCQLDADGNRLLETAIRRLALSARGYDRVLKVARTIADLAGAEGIDAMHLAEALQYRMAE